ncbi:cortical component Lsb5 [Schizosaccharomyces japonicus yFS275]|uniref:Cortical component Lsb5 n=1 Tax=Schizosaccharomyces japonicus (strain yFS275 / FY16936) TaxID=402676 RepID=B6JWY2_SCHJY|nr:cortical component Lsb5 [Schizosaccharomyces japonicus yFS275]EEB05883.1 cortical component Lsb5 [Schizosaccharomyces japonicus yFS275]
MGFFSDPKPLSAVTGFIETYTSDRYAEDDVSGIVQLCEVINLQSTGPSEAARAIRKKLKYGTEHQQLRALSLLQALIENAGPTFVHNFCDSRLVDRIAALTTEVDVPKSVQKRTVHLIRLWHTEYNDVEGMQSLCALSNRLPHGKQAFRARGSSRDGAETTTHRTVDMKKATPMLEKLIASANFASTNLTNAVQRLNPNIQSPAENKQVVQSYNDCRRLRRTILRYVQAITDEMWLGTLLKANDEINKAIELFKNSEESHNTRSDDGATESDYASTVYTSSSGRTSRRPSRNRHFDAEHTYANVNEEDEEADMEDDDDDENNPFSDRNRVD